MYTKRSLSWRPMRKIKSIVLTALLLSTLFIVITPPATADPVWFDTDWSYRKEINISDPQIDFQSMLNISKNEGNTFNCSSHCNDDFSDIRFAAENGSLLPYWIEKKEDGSFSHVWVNNTFNSSIIYMYYGNAGATTTSNGNETFDFFDDFLGSSLDTTKWEWSNEADLDTKTIANSEIHMAHDSGYTTAGIQTKDTNYDLNYSILEAKQKCIQGSYEPCQMGIRSKMQYRDGDWKLAVAGDAKYKVADLSFNTYYITRVDQIDGTTVKGTVQDTNRNYLGTNVTKTCTEFAKNYVYLKARSTGSDEEWKVDWVLIRKQTGTRPTFSIGAEEEPSIPIISNEQPADGITGVSTTNTELNVTINDTAGGLFNYTFYLDGVEVDNGTNVAAGSYSTPIDLLCGRITYTWWINVSNDAGWSNNSFSFSTESCPVSYIAPSPSEGYACPCVEGYVCLCLTPIAEFNVNISFYNETGVKTLIEKASNVSAETCVLLPVTRGQTYNWSANISEYGVESNYNNTPTYSFTVASEAYCAASDGSSGGGFVYLVIPIFFMIFGLIFMKTRKKEWR